MTDLRKKIVAVATVFTVLLGMAGPAMAATAEELQASIDALMAELADLKAELAELTGEVVTECCTFTRNLYPDIVGADVKCLQEYLNAAGYTLADSGAGSPGSETTYFGSLTRAAVKAWQDANDVEYGVWWGYFGPISQAKYDDVCIAEEEEEEEEEEAVLEGGAGSVESYDLATGISNEEVGEDEEDVVVAGLEIEVDEGSDLAFTAVQLTFDEGTVATTSDFEDYADEVSVWLESEEVARKDGDAFNDDNDWTKTVTLSGDNIIRAGETGTLYVKISGISNLDSNDAGDTWDVDFTSIRFMDAQGASITDTPVVAVTIFSFETYATAKDTELKIAAGEDAVNDAHVIDVDDDNETDDVEVLSFTIEIEGDSDVELKDLLVQFDTVTGGTGFINAMVPTVQLLMDDDEIGSENLAVDNADTETVTFDDLDVVLEAGETYDFLVTANFNELDGIILVAGDTFAANIGTTERDLIEAEDESGEDLATTDMTGTVTGEAHAIYDISFTFELKSALSSITTARDSGTSCSADTATYAIKFELTAFGGDITIDRSSEENDADTPDQGVEYVVTNTASNSATSSLTSTADNNTNDTGEAWLLEEGVTKEFTLTVAVTPNANHFAKVYLESINWDDDVTDTAPDLYYTAGLGEQKTSTGELYLSVTP